MAANANISIECIRKALAYDPQTGIFKWRKRSDCSVQWNSRFAGTVAGWSDWKGYILITINYVDYRAHRLAWAYVTGKWPSNDIDHKNRKTSDNRFENLREATRTENNGNAKVRKDSQSGIRGVSWDKSRKQWMARCSFHKKVILQKRFDKKSDAIAAYKQVAKAVFGEFVRTP